MVDGEPSSRLKTFERVSSPYDNFYSDFEDVFSYFYKIDGKSITLHPFLRFTGQPMSLSFSSYPSRINLKLKAIYGLEMFFDMYSPVYTQVVRGLSRLKTSYYNIPSDMLFQHITASIILFNYRHHTVTDSRSFNKGDLKELC